METTEIIFLTVALVQIFSSATGKPIFPWQRCILLDLSTVKKLYFVPDDWFYPTWLSGCMYLMKFMVK